MDAYLIKSYVDADDLTGLMYQVDKEIRQQELKRIGGNDLKKRASAAEKYLKLAGKDRPKLGGYHLENGKQAFCNGYTAILLNSPIPGLTVTDDDYPVNVTQFFEAKENACQLPVNFDQVELRIMAKDKTEKGKAPIFDIENRSFNAKLIVSVMDVLGGDITAEFIGTKTMEPMILSSENGKAIVLPLRK